MISRQIIDREERITVCKGNELEQACCVASDEYQAFLVERKAAASDIKSLKVRKVLYKTIFGICVAVFCFSTAMLYKEISEYRARTRAYAALRSNIIVQSGGFESNESKVTLHETASYNDFLAEQASTPPFSELEAWPLVNFDALSAVNPDIAAWIVSDDGTINYPIVHGGNNTYYLEHLFDRTENKAGCLFIDSKNALDFSDYNTIIYGHNMKDGSMFGELENYREQAYYDANPRMKLMTPNGNYILELFAGYVTDGDSLRPEFSDGAEFVKWSENAKSRSAFESGVVVTEKHRVVTLSTCAYDFENAYFVVRGILLPN